MTSRGGEVSRRTLARQIYEILLGQIREGSLRPGQRLVEAEIAAAVGTSRGPVREAIGMLQRGGLVRTDPFVGASIVELDEREIAEVYSLRSILEGYAASLVTQRRTADDIAQLQVIVDGMRGTTGPQTVARLRELDAKFHATLVRLADDEQLLQAWERLRGRIALYHTTVEAAFRDGDELAAMHERLIDALTDGDPVRAEQRVRAQLIANGREWTARVRERTAREPAGAARK
ncbi:MAG TPA: GntR family transcriptional regulator [Candidatus Limnocylindria bacterium]|nr:GntR family transcriptional regulator [Candidatus Limnocylindria bacterium]